MNRCHPADLRTALVLSAHYDGDEDDTDPDEPREPDPSPPAAGATDAAGGEGEGNDESPANDEPPTNPVLKKLHDEAARHRNRAKAAEEQVASLTAENRNLRLRMEFNEAAIYADLTDPDAAWKLAADELATVCIDEDGTVHSERVGEIIANVAERYPYLVAAPAPTAEEQALQDRFPALVPSGSSAERRRRPSRPALDTAYLARKFPALRKR